MEEFPRGGETVTREVAIPVAPFWGDHHLSGQTVLPAVEALQLLARSLPNGSGVLPLIQEQVTFRHLLMISPEQRELTVLAEYARAADGGILARLLTVRAGRQSAVTRRIEHAVVRFVLRRDGHVGAADESDFLLAESAVGEGEPFVVSAARLYDELVPFGAAYRNVLDEVRMTPDGATARISGGVFPEADGPLGSPFPFDAALHVACAWGQRYLGLVSFPVAFARREIHCPTKAGAAYRCRVVPLGEDTPGSLRFDLALYHDDGGIAEIVRGIEMRDIASGRRLPPAWIREGL